MKNIFLELKSKVQLKRDPLLKMLNIDPSEENLPAYLTDYLEAEQTPSTQETIGFIFTLLGKHKDVATKDKLYAVLTFFGHKLPTTEVSKLIDRVEKSDESITTKVRFFSLLFKSINDNELKKRLLSASITLVEKQNKISIFSNFVEHFGKLVASLTFDDSEFITIYLKLINYLEKHLVYKKLWKHYIIECLSATNPGNAQSAEATALIIKLLKDNSVSNETVQLLHQEPLKKNSLFPYLEVLLLGDFQLFAKLDKKALSDAGIAEKDLQRKVKIQAIPRVLSSHSKNVHVVSYQQISEILKIEKNEVEDHIIEAVQQGILKAKIDQFSETILISSVKLRTMRSQERVALQKNLTQLASRLEDIAKAS